MRGKLANGGDRDRRQLLQSLLVSVDLTPSSDRILARVARLPLADEATVALLHVVPSSLLPPEQRRAERDAQKALKEEARHLRERMHRRVRIEPVVRIGTAASEIATHAAQIEAELIVVGRGSGRALLDMFIGSTAERVIRQSQRPVLVVRRPARTGYARPLLALEQDHAADAVVRMMLQVIPPPRPPVDVVHAFDVPYKGMIYPSLAEDELEDWKSGLRSAASQGVNKILTKALQEANIGSGRSPLWRTHVRYGSPRMVVEKAMANADTDLLLLGTRARSGAAYVFLGSVAGDLLRAAKCDVLIVPPSPAKE